MALRTNTLRVRTPEGITFALPLAGPMTRFLAWLVDMLAITAASRLAAAGLQILDLISRDLNVAVTILAYFIISVGYTIILEWGWRGQTVGKRLLHLRVMDDQALNLTFSQVVIRNLLRVVDSLPGFYLVGGLACLISRRAQRLGDLAANTIVVRHPRPRQPDLDQLLTEKYNSFHNYPHLEARLRQMLGPQETGLALQALLRRDQLDPEARVELFQELAGFYRSMVSFPPEAVEGLSDEQYVRNVVGALYQIKSP